jgi:hypothetical protein
MVAAICRPLDVMVTLVWPDDSAQASSKLILALRTYRSFVSCDTVAFASVKMDSSSSIQPTIASLLNPALCANTERKAGSKVSSCQNTANFLCFLQIGPGMLLTSPFWKDVPRRPRS